MSPRRLSLVAGAGLLGAGLLSLAFWPRAAPAAPQATTLARAPVPLKAASAAAPAVDVASRFAQLPALHIENQTTRESLDLKLYAASGELDEAVATQLDDLLCDARRPKQRDTTQINRR